MNRKQRRTMTKPVQTRNSPAKTAAGVVPTGDADLFGAGVKRHQEGRLAEAEAYYRRVLAVQPNHADALHLLGVIAYQARRHESAVELIGQATKLNKQNSAYFSNLGVALRDLGKLDQAAAAYRQAIIIKPDDAVEDRTVRLSGRANGRSADAGTL